MQQGIFIEMVVFDQALLAYQNSLRSPRFVKRVVAESVAFAVHPDTLPQAELIGARPVDVVKVVVDDGVVSRNLPSKSVSLFVKKVVSRQSVRFFKKVV